MFGTIAISMAVPYLTIPNMLLDNNKESELKQATQDLIFQCHDFLRKTYDKSVVSLREMTRFTKCCKFFMDEYSKYSPACPPHPCIR